MEEILIPFGKYQGKPLEAMAQDKQYIEWIQSQGWLAEKYPQINTLIINNFKEPSETPDHNKIQGMFLEDKFCWNIAKAYNKIKPSKLVSIILSNPHQISNKAFEQNAIDVSFSIIGNEQEYCMDSFIVEIKPSVGDDYPAILRQIRSLKNWSIYNNNILLTNEYCGNGITQDQFIKLFYSQGIIVIFVKDIV